MTALFFLKITGFAAGGLIALQAFLAGRIRFRDAVIAAVGFLAVVGYSNCTAGWFPRISAHSAIGRIEQRHITAEIPDRGINEI